MQADKQNSDAGCVFAWSYVLLRDEDAAMPSELFCKRAVLGTKHLFLTRPRRTYRIVVSSRVSSLNAETTKLKGRKTKAVPIMASGAEAWRVTGSRCRRLC